MNDDVPTPKLQVPFRIVRGRALTVEQDSQAEIVQCTHALLRTTEGTRIEEPDYGIPDLEFGEGWVDDGQVQASIEEWEPRAAVEVSEDMIDDAVRIIRAEQSNREVING